MNEQVNVLECISEKFQEMLEMWEVETSRVLPDAHKISHYSTRAYDES